MYKEYEIISTKYTNIEGEFNNLKNRCATLVEYIDFLESTQRETNINTTRKSIVINDANTAVMRGVEDFGDILIFGKDVSDGVAGLAKQAVPQKIYDHLRALAEMTKKLNASNGYLGTTQWAWLKQKGISSSDESDKNKNDDWSVSDRTWHDGQTRREFTDHTKPNDATHPDMCVRIYFEYSKDLRKTIIAWVGRHP